MVLIGHSVVPKGVGFSWCSVLTKCLLGALCIVRQVLTSCLTVGIIRLQGKFVFVCLLTVGRLQLLLFSATRQPLIFVWLSLRTLIRFRRRRL